MNKKTFLITAVLLLAFILSMGCAKKEVAPTDPARAEISAEERARLAEEQRRKDMERQALEERRLQEERLAREREMDQAEKRVQDAVDEILASRIHFDFDSYELKPEARSSLQKISEHMKRFRDLRLVIEGHCDERGTAEYNLALGERRARAAYEFLILLGIESNRLQIISYGEERPLDPRSNETAWAQNRRAEFKILQ
ncbi:peptidoglycan-associated lipoprotein Pal [Desulfonatronovibrio hydrogenovorans]|uniref:peptidoglycan-associated lipoprotein Pal n=1 Tax=Desulfonatronovibrio hydrogenovorans TaxID=53245 RepID=UPI00048AE56B|nr:peptidoglycan-associated lipoprotein Pal [Desulfonatronovibrio hydrogenovorans]